AHLPREAKADFEAMSDRYAAEIAYDDRQLGRLLDAIAQRGRQRGLLVVFTADHGEGLGEHGERTHGILAYASTLHAPRAPAGPGWPEARPWQTGATPSASPTSPGASTTSPSGSTTPTR